MPTVYKILAVLIAAAAKAAEASAAAYNNYYNDDPYPPRAETKSESSIIFHNISLQTSTTLTFHYIL
jgi:hypothetical protein